MFDESPIALLVEDDVPMRNFLAASLAGAGYDIDEVSSCRHAGNVARRLATSAGDHTEQVIRRVLIRIRIEMEVVVNAPVTGVTIGSVGPVEGSALLVFSHVLSSVRLFVDLLLCNSCCFAFFLPSCLDLSMNAKAEARNTSSTVSMSSLALGSSPGCGGRGLAA